MNAPLWIWLLLCAVLVVAIVVDLVTLRGEVRLRAAVFWNVVWLTLGLAFTIPVWTAQGGTTGQEYLTGYLLERSLSLDNVFVFAVIFGYFVVPPELQPRALLWGVLGALVFRAIFIFAGAGLLATLHWMIYVFGAFLIATGIRLALVDESDVDPGRNIFLRGLKRFFTISDDYRGHALTTRINGRFAVTPMVAVLLVIASTDVVFAIDSIPAVFGVTDDLFVVLAANAFSVMGLRALYFLLADLLGRFEYLKWGLALVLVLVGVKMVLSDVWHVPAWLTLVTVAVVITASALVSLLRPTDPPGGAGAQARV